MLGSLAAWLHNRPKVKLAALLTAPLFWLVVAYIGSLSSLLVTSFYSINSFTGNVIHTFTFDNFKEVFSNSSYHNVILRTLGISISVTLICGFLAVPIAFYIAKIAKPRAQKILVAAILTPLWASYLVKIYSWRTMLEPNTGVIDWLLGPLGIHSPGFGFFGIIIGLSYLWLPYMILPIYAGFERLPNSLLDASGDLGARNFYTFRRVIAPIIFPSIVAGSVFTFSLSLGDYITAQIIGGKIQMLGNVVYQNYSDRKSTRLNSSHIPLSRMPSSA